MCASTHSLLSIVCAAFILGFHLPVAADSIQGTQARTHEAGVLLVKPREGLPNAEFTKILRQAGAQTGTRNRAMGLRTVKVEAGQEREVAERLQGNPHIEFVEINQAIAPESWEAPSDPAFGKAWHLQKIDAPTAWRTSTGSGVTVAVVDTGVNAMHPDLLGQVLVGHNVADDSEDTTDITGHGTQVAGIIAAATDNALDVAAVAPEARILPVRITNDPTGSSSFSNVAKGITWAADHGAQVINISYQAWISSTIESAAEYARSRGVTVLVAAGNDGLSHSKPNSPNFVVVGATDANDVRSSFSASGTMLDFWAPGEDIPTTSKDGAHAMFNGTSAATPVVSGVFAQVIGINPRLSPDDAESVMRRTAHQTVAGQDGYGRVNAGQAVTEAAWVSQVDTTAPTVSFVTPVRGDVVQGLLTLDVAASDNLRVSRVELYANGQFVGRDSVAPFQFSWNGSKVSNVSVAFTATAYDVAGNAASTEVQVRLGGRKGKDHKAPTIRLVTPNMGSAGSMARVAGDMSINATVQDKQGLDSVRLTLDGQPLAVTRDGVFDYLWDSRSVANGRHVLRLSALDISGNSKSIKLPVRVVND